MGKKILSRFGNYTFFLSLYKFSKVLNCLTGEFFLFIRTDLFTVNLWEREANYLLSPGDFCLWLEFNPRVLFEPLFFNIYWRNSGILYFSLWNLWIVFSFTFFYPLLIFFPSLLYYFRFSFPTYCFFSSWLNKLKSLLQLGRFFGLFSKHQLIILLDFAVTWQGKRGP